MKTGSFERATADPYLESGASDSQYERATYDRELDIIVAHYNEDSEEPAQEIPALTPALEPERDQNPQMTWPEANPDGTVSNEVYRQWLDWRLTGAAFLLDAVAPNITTDEEATEWAELKQAIAAAKSIGDLYAKVDYVIEIEKAVTQFAVPLGATYADYVGGRE
jgi:hypothetical protein